MAGSSTTGKSNRGPSAGPENRAALIAAARAVFDEQGASAPLSAVAKRAGVGQGSLYRHFPDRISLALAVLEENMTQISALAASPDSTLRDLCDLVTHHTEATAAFLSLLGADGQDERLAGFEFQLRSLFATKLATDTELLGPSATLDDLMLAVGMVAGIAMQSPRETRHAAATGAWDLLQRGLSG
ncbi:TetR/AcrR family transcriptional regulator [Demequina sp.]|uniref:TetR/AcrR family transcriptional regulator n=1 Tax=Demequina sp. TaxID=2050685 RepID=UPI003D14F19B